MKPVSIVMFSFSVLLLVAAWITGSGDTGLIRTMRFTKVKNEKEYARFLGRTLAMTAAGPVAGGIAGLFLPAVVAVVIAVGIMIAAVTAAAKRAGDYYR